ncbi:MAG TPA: host attachment protein [Verrucomicrobiae bacterium]|nr:host attachment protein [Verrucomicrobiae bacterium]
MKKLIVLMDLGCLYGYRLVRDEIGGSDRLEAVHRHDNVDAHVRFGQKVTDQAGRFPSAKNVRGGSMSQGEDHNGRTETERRLINIQLEQLKSLLDQSSCDAWYLAAPGNINHRIIEGLLPIHRQRLHKNLAADLTKLPPHQVLERFRAADPVPGFGLNG